MAAPQSKSRSRMARYLSWILVVLLSSWSLYLMVTETQKIVAGKRAKMQSFSGLDLEKGKKLLVKQLGEHYGIDPANFNFESTTGKRSILKVKTDAAKSEQLIEGAGKIDFSLRELRVEKVVCEALDNSGAFTHVTSPTFLGIGASPDLILVDLLKESGGIAGNAMWLQSFLLSGTNRHVQRYLNSDPTDPALIVNQAIVNEKEGKDITPQLEQLLEISKETSVAKRRRAKLAGELLAVLKCEPSSNCDLLIDLIRTNLPKDYFRTYLLGRTYRKFQDPEKEKAIIRESAEERDKTARLFSVMITALLASLTLVVFSLTHKQKLWQLPSLDTSEIASKAVYGWVKPIIIAFLSCSISILLIVLIFIRCPPLLVAGGSTVIAAFEPARVASLELCDQLATTMPIILITYLLVGRKFPFLEFVKLKFNSNGYDFRTLAWLGLAGFSLCWALANISMVLSMWFHYPGDKASTVGIGLLAASGNAIAILLWFLASAIFAPITEEIIFRGILHSALRRHWGMYPSMIFGSLIFALVHGEFTPWWMIHKFALGYVNVYLLEKTGSIVPGIINHMLLNTFVVVFLCLCS